MKGVARPRPTGRQLVRFALIGAASAAAYLLLYLLLRTVTTAQVANVVALVVTQVANTATNRRFTFGLRGSQGALRHQAGRAGRLRLRARRCRPGRWRCSTTSTPRPDASPRSRSWSSPRASRPAYGSSPCTR